MDTLYEHNLSPEAALRRAYRREADKDRALANARHRIQELEAENAYLTKLLGRYETALVETGKLSAAWKEA